jgi:hypothetical protein
MIGSPRTFSRRVFLRLLGAPALPRILPASETQPRRLEWDGAAADRGLARRYRADAQISLLSVPILRRSGVGAGAATWSEKAGVRLLAFAGHSLPDRAAGLNRMGLIRELSRRSERGTESLYFGVMTASPEESAAEARNALHTTAREQSYTAIEGRIAPGNVETTAVHFVAPAQTDPERLVELAKAALADGSQRPPEFDPRAFTASTFLDALAGLLQDTTAAEAHYIYNARVYRLRVTRSPDPQATDAYRERRLIGAEDTLVRVDGRVQRVAGGKPTSFALWIAEGAGRPLPLRIDYHAKPYLRLIFEAEAP